MTRSITVKPLHDPEIPYAIEGLSKTQIEKLIAVLSWVEDTELDEVYYGLAESDLFRDDVYEVQQDDTDPVSNLQLVKS